MELLSTALESSTMTNPTNTFVDLEFKKAIKSLKGKYARFKGKDKALDALAEGAPEDDMNIG